ncbi:MAG TPA: pseudouridine synthase [Chloroflexota bacterium]|jgi:23S rRNA pseudouridine2605 synthase|nr:pseudouridine synthase [Chloroflexota bacterium]
MTEHSASSGYSPESERLQRYLARSGVAARRQAEELMRAGRVTVNGELALEPGYTIRPGIDRVQVDGSTVQPRKDHHYLMLNKPEGVVTTVSDPRGRKTVLDLVKSRRRLFPVGRLDADSAGLLLLTDDGELAQRLTHPRYGVQKTYVVEVRGELLGQSVDTLRKGVRLTDGYAKPSSVKLIRQDHTGGVIEITLGEGRNREVRRMCAAVKLKVTSLVRTRLGPLSVQGLRPGAWRPLTGAEVKALYEATE